MGTARIQLVSINTIQAEPTARIQMASVNVVFTETPPWEVIITGASAVEATLTADASAWPTLTGRWTFPVVERLGFLTEIIPSHNRTEQRIAHRVDGSGNAVPTQSFSTQLFAAGEDGAGRLEHVLHGWLQKSWPVPIWPQAQLHTASLPAGSSAIAVDTRYCDYRAGGYAIIWQGEDDYEIVEIDSVADAALTLDGVTLASYTGAKWIMPCRIGWVTSAGALQRYHGGALVDLTWEVEDVAAVTGFTADLTYDSMTVLTEPAYWPGDCGEVTHDPDVAVIGGQTGPFEVIVNSTFNEVTQSHVWHPQTLQACWKLRQFLHAVKGRQTAFLVPTFRDDLVVTRPVGASDTSLYVAHRGLTRNMNLNDLRTYLAFRPAGATIIPRKVSGMSVVSTAEEKIDLDTAPGAAFGVGDILCWVDKCRLASDAVEFEWRRRGELSCNAQLVRVT